MKNITKIKKTSGFLLSIIMLVGVFFRFYNLNWGAPFYFHPDERNIASSVSQLQFPSQMNPNFFAYGSLPIYIIYFKGIFIKFLQNLQLSSFNSQLAFDQAILISRIYSAVLSTTLVPLAYITGKKIHNKNTGLLAAFLTMTSVGFIQFAHFGTFEMWLTFFSVLLFILCLKILNEYRSRYVLLSGVVMGILISTKISHLALIPLPIMCVIIVLYKSAKTYDLLKDKIKIFFEGIAQISAIILISAFIFLITNPYVVLNFSAFKNSMDYETGVALGTTEVFYTHEFFDTIPVIYQFLNVYPFLLNPIITILFIPSFLYIFWKSIKDKNKNYFLLITFYLLLFTSQAFLFVKWTRYMVPTLPFIYFMVAITLADFFINNEKVSSIKYQVSSIVGIICLIFTFSYYVTVLVKPDSRVEAAKWAQENIDKNSGMLSESYDLGIIAFNSSFSRIALCDMYNLEINSYPCDGFPLDQALSDSNYIILPSERVLKMSILKKQRLPKRYQFYGSLLYDKSRYKLIYKTPCDIYCKILYLGDTLYSLEQTTHVFDRPTVYIIKQIK